MSNSTPKITIPDMSRYGLFLCPKFYRNEHGFKGEARGLLLLDQKGIIQPNAAKENNFTRLFTSSTAVLYAVNPNEAGGYITASQLLQALNLGKKKPWQLLISASPTLLIKSSSFHPMNISITLFIYLKYLSIRLEGLFFFSFHLYHLHSFPLAFLNMLMQRICLKPIKKA